MANDRSNIKAINCQNSEITMMLLFKEQETLECCNQILEQHANYAEEIDDEWNCCIRQLLSKVDRLNQAKDTKNANKCQSLSNENSENRTSSMSNEIG